MKEALINIYSKNKLFIYLFLFWLIAAFVISTLFPAKTIFVAINQLHTPLADRLMTVLSAYGRGESIAIVLISLLLLAAMRNKTYIATGIFFGISIPLINYFCKEIFDQPRPMSMLPPGQIHSVSWLENLYNNSFPSGHTMGAFGLFLILNHFLPRKNPFITFLFFILAFGCAYSRVYLGHHFFADVLAGSIIGVLTTFVIIVLVKYSNQFNKNEV